MASELLMARGRQQYRSLLCMANRHGLIAGATGTTKTVIAEQLSQSDVAVRRLEEEDQII